MFTIYSNLQPKLVHESTFLYENEKYFIRLDEIDEDLIKDFLSKSSLKNHITWHPGNKVGEIKISNYIGSMRIFDVEYDVRSKKFDKELTGKKQLELITKEIDELSRNISFSYDSSIFSSATSDWETVQNDTIHRLNYLYYVFFESPHFEAVPFQLQKIKINPSLSYSSIEVHSHIWKVKQVTPEVVLSIAKLGISDFTDKNLGDSKIPIQEKILSFDNQDNRFVRFFFEYCQQVCLKVLAYQKKLPDEVLKKASTLLGTCREMLHDSFFETVGPPQTINTNSTILSSREGYKDLLSYYINSLFSVKHLYEDYKTQLSVDLIDIATLYEIWCFYKIAFSVLGSSILITQKTSSIKDGKISYTTIFENSAYEVSYNKTYSTSNGGSYSTTLRPDISVLKKDTNKIFHFDAKYRINSSLNADNSEFKSYKNDDINKMHAYLDAIYSSRAATVLYPGEKSVFFVKTNPPTIILDMTEEFIPKGVGAVPLIPGNENIHLINFLDKLI